MTPTDHFTAHTAHTNSKARTIWGNIFDYILESDLMFVTCVLTVLYKCRHCNTISLRNMASILLYEDLMLSTTTRREHPMITHMGAYHKISVAIAFIQIVNVRVFNFHFTTNPWFDFLFSSSLTVLTWIVSIYQK